MVRALLIVDVQNGFLNEFTHHLPGRLASLIDRGDYDLALFTRFVNAANGPYHTILNWHACEHEPETSLAPEMARLAKEEVTFSKPGFTGMPEELGTYLAKREIKEIAMAGIDTDMCVLKIAMDLFDVGIKPVVLTDCCASTAGLQAHFAGLAVLSRNIGAEQLREAGLSTGTPAAPKASDAPSDADASQKTKAPEGSQKTKARHQPRSTAA